MDISDQTVSQAWLMAIPSAITALSTWYMKRKNEKNSEKTSDRTEQAIALNTSKILKEVKDLQDRVSVLEEMNKKTRDCQLVLAQKYVDTTKSYVESTKAMESRVEEARAFFEVLKAKMKPPTNDPTKPAEAPNKPEVFGKVIVVDEPVQTNGKVIRKP